MQFPGAAGWIGFGLLGGPGVGLGAIVLLLGLVALTSAIGLWRMSGWAWWLATILGVISIVFDAVTFNWFGLLIALLFTVYLFVVRNKYGVGGRPAGR